MKKLLLIPAALIVIFLAAILILPGLIPSEVYKAKINEQVSKSLGRDVTIAGDVDVSVFPRISASASNVTIANPAGFDGPQFATMDALSAKVKLLPLLSKRVEIDAFELVSPTITLVKRKDGSTNWDFAGEKPETETPGEGFKRNRAAGDLQASVGIFTITDGAIDYRDAVQGKTHTAKDVNITLALPAMDKKAKVNGDMILDDLAMTISGELDTPQAFLTGRAAPFTIDLKSDLGDVKSSGRFEPSEDLALSANIDANIPDASKLEQFAGEYAGLVDSADIKGDITYGPAGFALSNADVDVKGALVDGTYKGSFSTLSGAKIDGVVKADVKDLPALLTALNQDIPQAVLVSTAKVSAKLGGSPDAMTVSNIDLTAKGDALTAGYKGGLTLAGAPTLSGDFTADVTDTQTVTRVLKIDIPALKAARTLNVSGNISGPASAPNVSGITAKAGGENLNLDFTGDYAGGKTASLNGSFNADIKSVAALAKTAEIDVPYSDIVGGLTAKGILAGPIDTLNVKDLSAALSGGALTADFDNGAVTLGKDIAVSGTLNIAADSVRALAAATGTSLPEGNVFGPFSLSGNVSGTAQDMRFDNAKLSFDAIRGEGGFAVKTSGSKPMLTGNLNLPSGLDLAPYMAKSTKQEKTGGLKPWSEQPLDLSPLNAANADLRLSTPFVKTDRLDLGQSEITAVLSGGKLTAKVPGAQLYSGTGDITLVLDGSRSVPAASMDIALNRLSAPSFLGASAGFDKVTGTTSTTLSVSGQGRTQSELMKSLNGSGNFGLAEGALKGIDLGAFLGGIESAWTNRSLPSGVGPGQATQFKDLVSGFNIQNGVVTVKDFKLSGKGILAQGGGTLDIGNQKIDFSLRPRLIDDQGNPKGSGLAGFGIPVRLSGSFNNVKAGLDTDLLGDIVKARAKAKAADEIKDRVGGPLGDILGGVLGGTPGSSPAPAQEPPAQTGETNPETPEPKTQEPKKEKSDEEKALDLLGGIFGKKN